MALTDKLTAIGNAIRTKTGGTNLLTLDQMATEISNIQGGGTVEELTITSNGTYNPPTGIDGYAPVVVNVPQDGGPPESALHITGNCQYRFAHNGWNWFIEKYRNQITTNISNFSYGFYESDALTSIPFELNCSFDSFIACNNLFYGCYNLIKAPRINVLNSDNVISIPFLNSIFWNCWNLIDIDYDYFSHWFSEEQWNRINRGMSNNTVSNLFFGCKSLRKHPDISMLYSASEYISLYQRTFHSCYCLDEILDMPVWSANLNKNKFNNDPFFYTFRLKNLTFKTNSDGTPKTADWGNQTINLTSYVGYIDTDEFNNYIKTYGPATGITEDKKVSDDATYQALKDDPNWYAYGINYSRYNHNSAVRTINSLPDTSAYLTANGGTNTIQFKGESGALTDGGAINTLTEEEIAVATAKGWTVSLV